MQCKRKHAENAFLKYVYSVMKFTLFRILLLSSKLQRKLHGIFHKSCALAPISLPVSLIDLLPGSRVSVIFVTSTFVRRNLKLGEMHRAIQLRYIVCVRTAFTSRYMLHKLCLRIRRRLESLQLRMCIRLPNSTTFVCNNITNFPIVCASCTFFLYH